MSEETMSHAEFYGGTHVLVTGGAGFIGTNLVRELIRHKAKVRATIHTREPQIREPAAEYVRCDLTRAEDCVDVVKDIDYAFFCAAHSSGAYAIANSPLSHITDNLIMNARLFEATENVRRCLFISSSTVYPVVEYPVKEAEAFSGDPHPSYFGSAWMKRYSEKLAEFFSEKYERQIAVVRPTNVYGPFDKFDFETSHVLPALVRRAVERQNPLEVWGDGTAVRDFIYVSDMVEAMLRTMESWAEFDPINIGSGDPVTVKESVETIVRLADHGHVEIIYDPLKPTTIPVRLVDLSKANELLGFHSRVSFEEGIRKTIDWYRETRS